MDTNYFVELSDELVGNGGNGILESDDLSGSAVGLGNGYGQSKWVSEQLIRYAGRELGLRGCIVRPGYVFGDSKTGVMNTDDFLARMMKGCVQLGVIPNIHNTINMVPVDHVARVVVASAFHPPKINQILLTVYLLLMSLLTQEFVSISSLVLWAFMVMMSRSKSISHGVLLLKAMSFLSQKTMLCSHFFILCWITCLSQLKPRAR